MHTENSNKPTYHSTYAELYLNNTEAASRYDKAISNTYESFVWELEKHFLLTIFQRFDPSLIEYMDYACGTGRIVNFLRKEFAFNKAIGADISDEMLQGAKINAPHSQIEFVRLNLGEFSGEYSQKFDVMTAFRLFLNLEHDNREIILRGMHNILKDNGVLVVNNHMNRYSLKGCIAFILHTIFKIPLKHQRQPGQRSIINTMSEHEFKALLFRTGFVVEEVYRFGLLPGHKNVLLLPKRILFPLEIFLSRVPLLNRLAKDQIYVCRRTAQ